MNRLYFAAVALAVAALALTPQAARADDTEIIKATYPGMTIKFQDMAPIDKTAIYGLVLQAPDGSGFAKAVRMEGEGAVEIVSQGIAANEVADAKIDFVSDGKNMIVRTKDSREDGDFYATINIYDLVDKPGALLFTIKNALNAEISSTPHSASLPGLLLWQKTPFFLNDASPPAKYSYFMVTWDEAGGRYVMGSHLLRINGADLPIEAELNNKGVDYYLAGNLVKARAFFERAQEMAGTAARTINSNFWLVNREINLLEQQEYTSSGSVVSTIFDKAKLLFYEGQFEACIREIRGPDADEGMASLGETRSVTQDRLAMLGLSYAEIEDFDKLHSVDQTMATAPVAFRILYYEALLDVLSRENHQDELEKYMIKLEGLDPNDPTLTFYKARYLIQKNDLERAVGILDRYLAAMAGKGVNVERCRLALYEVAALSNDEQEIADLQKQMDSSPKIDLRWYIEALNFTPSGKTVNPNDVFLRQPSAAGQ
jgi:hypothetical protein